MGTREYVCQKSSDAQRQLQGNSANWGIYTNDQAAAKALAVVFGFNGKPEVHGSGMYVRVTCVTWGRVKCHKSHHADASPTKTAMISPCSLDYAFVQSCQS